MNILCFPLNNQTKETNGYCQYLASLKCPKLFVYLVAIFLFLQKLR